MNQMDTSGDMFYKQYILLRILAFAVINLFRGWLHSVDTGNVAVISEVHAAHIFRAEA
jgi:hypothetical protein